MLKSCSAWCARITAGLAPAAARPAALVRRGRPIRPTEVRRAEVIHAAANGGLDDGYYQPSVGVLWRIDPARDGTARGARGARIPDLIVDGLRTRPAESTG
jgi:hypothetical protein